MKKTKIQEDLEKKLEEIDRWKKEELSKYRNKTKGIAEDRKNKAICEALIETLTPYNKENCSRNRQRPQNPVTGNYLTLKDQVTGYSPIANLPASVGIKELTTHFDRAMFLFRNNDYGHAVDYLIASQINPNGEAIGIWNNQYSVHFSTNPESLDYLNHHEGHAILLCNKSIGVFEGTKVPYGGLVSIRRFTYDGEMIEVTPLGRVHVGNAQSKVKIKDLALQVFNPKHDQIINQIFGALFQQLSLDRNYDLLEQYLARKNEVDI